MKAAIIGFGGLGKAVGRLLDNISIGYKVFDRSLNADHCFITMSGSDIKETLKGCDIVINCGPHNLSERLAIWSAKNHKHYFCATEDAETVRTIYENTKDSETVVCPGCGYSPGFVGIYLNHLKKSSKNLNQATVCVGVIPEKPEPPLYHSFSWNIEGGLNQFIKKSEAMVDGRLTTIEPLSKIKSLEICGVECEGTNTSGGIHFPESYGLENLEYLTLRHAGHYAIFKAFVEVAKKSPRNFENVVEILRTWEEREDSMLLTAFIETRRESGVCSSKKTEIRIRSQNVIESANTIHAVTALGLTGVVELLLDGKLKNGFVKMSDIDYEDFRRTYSGRLLTSILGL